MSKRRVRKSPKHKERKLTRREFVEKSLMVVASIAISGVISDKELEPMYSSEELTLETAKSSSDQRFVQAYLDKILSNGRIKLQNSVVYDPYGSQNVKFLEDQLARYPEKRDYINRQIETLRQSAENRRQRERGQQNYLHSPTGTYTGIDGSKRIFVYEIPDYAVTDDDILWFLEHERCHAEDMRIFDLFVQGELDPETKKIVDATLTMPDMEEATCYTHQFKTGMEGLYAVSGSAYNAVVEGYKPIYDRLKREADGTGIKNQLIRQALSIFTNPYELKTR